MDEPAVGQARHRQDPDPARRLGGDGHSPGGFFAGSFFIFAAPLPSRRGAESPGAVLDSIYRLEYNLGRLRGSVVAVVQNRSRGKVGEI